MSQTFRTQASLMLSTANRVDSSNDQVQQELSRLRTVVESVSSHWAGSAQVSFNQLMERWTVSATKLREALSSISENIRMNARSFEGMEAENVAAFNSVGAGSGTHGLAL